MYILDTQCIVCSLFAIPDIGGIGEKKNRHVCMSQENDWSKYFEKYIDDEMKRNSSMSGITIIDKNDRFGIVFACAYSSTCTDNSTYLYKERHKQNRYFRVKTRRYP